MPSVLLWQVTKETSPKFSAGVARAQHWERPMRRCLDNIAASGTHRVNIRKVSEIGTRLTQPVSSDLIR